MTIDNNAVVPWVRTMTDTQLAAACDDLAILCDIDGDAPIDLVHVLTEVAERLRNR